MKTIDYPAPPMRKASTEWDRPISIEFKEQWVIYDWAYINEDTDTITRGNGFAIENYSDPHYGLEFDTREDLNRFIELLHSAADKVWGPDAS